MSRSLHKITVATFLLAAAVILYISGMWYRSTENLVQTNRLVAHTREVLGSLEGVRAATEDATSAVREYLTMGDETNAQEYVAATGRSQGGLQRLRDLTAEDPRKQQQIAALEGAIEERLARAQEDIERRREQGALPDSARRLGVGTGGSQAIRNQIAEIAKEAEDLLQRRTSAVEVASQRMIALNIVFPLIALTFLAVFFYRIQRDFTARQEAENALQESEKRTLLILDRAHTAFIEMNDEGMITAWNPQAEATFGWTQSEAVGQPVASLIIPTQLRGAHEQGFKRFLETGQGPILNRRIQMKALRRGGEEFPVEMTISAIPWQGTHIFSAFLQDITERRRAEEALRASEERHRLLFDASPIPMWVTDIETLGFLAVNNAAVRHYGYSREEFLAMSIKDIRPPEEVPIVLKRLDQVTPGMETTTKTRHRKKDGTLIEVQIDLHGLTLGDKPAILVLVNDVTERTRAEKALQQAHEKLSASVVELQQREKDITRLSEMADLLQSCQTPEEAYAVLAQPMAQLFPGFAGGIYMISASRNLVEAVVTWGNAGLEGSVFSPPDCWALRRGRLHLYERNGSAPECAHRSHAASDYLCIPMMAQSEAMGVLHLESAPGLESEAASAESPFTPSRQRLATAAAEQIALALANLNLRESLRNQSTRDPLTNLFNRRFMEESLERELRRAARSNESLGIIMLDVDHFKRFNDTYGHDAGDEMLRLVARLLQTGTRAEDVACRYGGEEFVVILPNSTLADTTRRAEQLRQRARQIRLKLHGHPDADVSLSLGVAAFPTHGSTADTLLRVADQALYHAKHEGRDRVVAAQTAG